LLGAVCPKTLAGTMVGKPIAAAAPIESFRKSLRVCNVPPRPAVSRW
jgi:hypothetical protein